MFLAVDIGNSQTCFGVFDDSHLKHLWRVETKPSRTADEYASFLFPLLQHHGLKAHWDGIALCSVVPAAEFSFGQFCQSYFREIPFKVNSSLKLGFTLNLDVPSEVGADRLANSAFAVRYLKLPAIIVDFGTATTFDVISREKTYEGGVILPGVKLGVEALGSKTSKLPQVDLEYPPRVIGKNTIECIQSGILYGYCDMIDGLLGRTLKELGSPAEIILTGGLSALFQGRLHHKTRYIAEVTLEGTRLIHQDNRGSHPVYTPFT